MILDETIHKVQTSDVCFFFVVAFSLWRLHSITKKSSKKEIIKIVYYAGSVPTKDQRGFFIVFFFVPASADER